ncbi:MAG: hypothetical protein ACRDTE_00175 [Pseudonocardiaceae bacterium]
MGDEDGRPSTNGSGKRVQADSAAARIKPRARRRGTTKVTGRGETPDKPPDTHSSRFRVSERATHGGVLGVRVSDFFGELAKQLAGRWLSLLVIPGVLFLAAGWTGLSLRQADALDAHRLTGVAGDTATKIAGWPGSTQALAAVGLLLAAVAVGLVVQALVGPVRALCLGQWTGRALGRLAGSRTRRRQDRWRELYRERAALEMVHPAHDRTTEQQRRIDQMAARTNQIAMAEPGSPTWMGDRMHALTQVATDRYGLDLAFGWPRLWLVLPDSVRAEINTAQSGYASAVFTIAWSLPYLALSVLWWPAALAGAVIAAAGRSRARAKITNLTELAEAALDVHGRSLAIALGVAEPTSTGPLTADEGRHITDIARKGR